MFLIFLDEETSSERFPRTPARKFESWDSNPVVTACGRDVWVRWSMPREKDSS